MYNVQLERMREKLITLRSLDPDLELFGAENHEYEMVPVWTQEDITQFEQKWRIELPEDYKVWLLHMGTGGAGPYYGLENPDDGVYAVLGYDDELNAVSDPFQFTEAWNWNYDWFDDSKEEEEWEALEHEYFDPKWSAGMLRISDFGCGVSMNLVVKGPPTERSGLMTGLTAMESILISIGAIRIDYIFWTGMSCGWIVQSIKCMNKSNNLERTKSEGGCTYGLGIWD